MGSILSASRGSLWIRFDELIVWKKNTMAWVGLGAIIVFIGTLLAVTSSAYVMINQLERIAQSTEKQSTLQQTKHTHKLFLLVLGLMMITMIIS